MANFSSFKNSDGNLVEVEVTENGTIPVTFQSASSGDPVDFQFDANDNLLVSQGTLLGGEDLTNNTMVVTPKPVVSSSYSSTAFSNFGAATNAVAKNSAGMIKSIHAQNENAAIRYLQIFNKATGPTEDSEVPIFSFAIPAGTGAAPGIVSIGAEFFGEAGYYLSAGVTWGISVDPDVFDANAVTAGEHQINGTYL
jgi:hypothetical protein